MRNASRGQAVVEFAFILPVFLLLVLGTIEIGRAFVFGVAVQDGAREGARLGANARLDPAVTDAYILQRVVDASSPAMLGCAAPTSAPATINCGGGTWTFRMSVTPSGSSTSYSSFSALPASASPQMNGATVEVKVQGSVSLLAGLATGWSGMSLYQIQVQGDAVMVVL